MKFICILLPISTSPLMKSLTPVRVPRLVVAHSCRDFSYSHILLTDSLTISGEIFA